MWFSWLILGALLATVTGCGSDSDDSEPSGGSTGDITGRLLDGGGLPVPLSCAVSTYYQGILDPNSPDFGAKRAHTESFMVEAWPHEYTLPDVTAIGSGWYVAGRCDTDGDSLWDIGGWYPGPTPTLVAPPANGIDITILPSE